MVKFIAGVIIAVLVIVFALLNAELVELRLYFWTVTMSRALLLIIVLGIGIVIGYILNGLRISKKSKSRKQEDSADAL